MPEESTKKTFSKSKKIKFALFTLAFLIVIVMLITELVLAIFHYDSTYARMNGFSTDQSKWWTCDSVNGPRYVANQVSKSDSEYFKNEIWYYNRLKIVNNEGYHDRDEFTQKSADNDSLKVLFAGDSFTWGASADVDSSYVDVFEQDIKKVYPSIVWNTGIPATGTNHALFTTKKFLPIQKSNFVILGFYVGNDFSDNLLPFDQLVFNNLASCYNLWDYDKDFKPYRITKKEAFKKATGSYPMEDLNFFQKLTIRSRAITFFGELKDKLVNRLSGKKQKQNEEEYKMTEFYLKQLNDYVKANNAELIVVVIPAADDLKEKESHYLNAVKILDGLSIPHVDNINLFNQDNYLKAGGGHWKNSGHIIAGHALSKYLVDHIKQKQLTTFKKN